ncbi:hypothetical protein GCM10010840_36290 [Deinococcus aerolatus]|uniref:Chain length determinant protein n=1 Tax=Deinococcus aerolatus TaxID=522487 RepID=A0ABQ2GHK5_9DEIO|nr:hypothetical protein [Deinococcus aerolatus]GGL94977.1 hypothetical protein GCM10010840_36290 [Deinococcus aerolatus]
MMQSRPPRSDTTSSDLELPQVARLLRRAALPVLGIAALAGVGGYLLSNLQPKVYTATSSLFTEQVGGGSNALNDSMLRPSPLPRGGLQQALHSPAVVKLVVNRLRASEIAPATINKVQRELQAELSTGGFKKLKVELDPNSPSNSSTGNVYILSARADSPELARTLANASVAALQLWDIQRAQRRLEQARAALKLQLDVLDRSAQDGGLSTDDVNRQARAAIARDLAVIGASRQSVAGTLDVIAEAVDPAGPTSPRPKRTAALSALLALLFAGGGAVLLGSRRALVDTRDSDPDDASALYRRETSDARNVTSTVPQR